MQQGGGYRHPWSHHPRQALHRAREEGILGQQDRQASHRPHQGSHRAVARSVAEPKLFNLRSGSTLFSSGTSTVLPVPLKKYLVQTNVVLFSEPVLPSNGLFAKLVVVLIPGLNNRFISL